MRNFFCIALLLSAGFASAADLFNGKDLTGWNGNPAFWSVKDGAITGETTKDNPTKGNTFLIYTNGNVDDFELRLSYKIVGGNSGIQYRSKVIDPKNWVVSGYQADIEDGKTYSGILYEEAARGILAKRGEKVVIKDADGKHKAEVVGSLGKSEEIQKKINEKDWNEYRIVARGNHLQHFINGTQTV